MPDLRGNGGSNDAIGDYLFRYLHAGKFQQFSDVRVKISRDVFPARLPAPEGKVVSITEISPGASLERSFPKPDAFFAGRVYLLTDNFTYSAAAAFAAMFRDYQAGRILGFETGGLPITFGEAAGFHLANSGSTSRYPAGSSGRPSQGPAMTSTACCPTCLLRRRGWPRIAASPTPCWRARWPMLAAASRIS